MTRKYCEESMTDAQVVLAASCHGVGRWHEDGALRRRLEVIAKRLELADRKLP